MFDTAEASSDRDDTLWDENEARRTDRNDVDIFKTVDSLLLDDDLLQTMRAALQARPSPGPAVLKFVVSLIQSRFSVSSAGDSGSLDSDYSSSDVPPAFEPRIIPETSHAPIVGILADALMRELVRIPAKQWITTLMVKDSWSDLALLLLVVLCPQEIEGPIPQAATSVFSALIAHDDTRKYGCAMLANNIAMDPNLNRDGCGLARVLMSMTDALRISDSSSMAFTLKSITHWHVFTPTDDVLNETDTFDRLLRLFPDPDCPCAPQTLAILVDLSLAVLWSAVDAADSSRHPLQAFSEIHSQLLGFALDAIPVIEEILPSHNYARTRVSGAVTLKDLLSRVLTTAIAIPFALDCLATRTDVLISDAGRELLLDGFYCDDLPGAYFFKVLCVSRLD